MVSTGVGPVYVMYIPQGGMSTDSRCTTGWWRGGEWRSQQRGGTGAWGQRATVMCT